GHAPHAPARPGGGPHLPHDHRHPDLRHPVRHDQRWPRHCDRDARHVHPSHHDRGARLRLRLGAGRPDVQRLAPGNHRLPALHASGSEPGARLMRCPRSRRQTVWLAGIVVAANGFLPAAWILLTSFKTETELMRVPITIWPAAPTLGNYVRVFVDQPILTFLGNSLVVAGASTLLGVLVSALAAYALVRLP